MVDIRIDRQVIRRAPGLCGLDNAAGSQDRTGPDRDAVKTCDRTRRMEAMAGRMDVERARQRLQSARGGPFVEVPGKDDWSKCPLQAIRDRSKL